MKYTVIGIQHKCGTFTPTTGKDAGTEKEYDFYLLHSIKKNRENIGGMEVVPVRCSPDVYGQLVAECGGHPEDILNRRLTSRLRNCTRLPTSKILRLWSNEVQPNGNEPATTTPATITAKL